MIVCLVDIGGIDDHKRLHFDFTICTDLQTCFQRRESIVLAGKDTMMHVHASGIGSLYRGLCTYAHINRYLGECVV